MGASKKKRGQQRKAKRLDIIEDSEGHKFIDKSQQDKCNTLVQGGNNEATLALATLSRDADNISFRDMIPSILGFLNRCKDETFDQVLTSVGGNLKSPSIWLGALFRAQPSYSLQIAESIGPLVSSMCNDTERLFFRSKKHWREGIITFVELIHIMINNNVGKRGEEKREGKNQVIEALLQHDGLLESVIQWGHWDAEHRPDIVNELVDDDCDAIVEMGRDISIWLVGDTFQWDGRGNRVSNEVRDRVKAFGMAPIVAKSYDPNCMISYTSGLIRQAKSEGGGGNKIPIIRVLIQDGNCVDKGVISEVIDLGLNYTAVDFKLASTVANLSLSIILEDANFKLHCPNDTRSAFAVRAGLIEMCLSFIELFGEHELFDVSKVTSMFQLLYQIFRKTHAISLHQKTAKAIRSKRAIIEEKLFRLESNRDVTISSRCKELLDMVKSILDMNGSYCCRCNKSLSRTEVLECNGCGCMAYCSKACQREDWLDGHNVTCNKLPTDEFPRIFAKLKELEMNLTMIQLKLFLDNSETILNQANSLDLPLCDCLVVFDLRECPHTITVMKYTEHCINSLKLDGFECSRSRDNITCVYRSCLYSSDLGEEKGQVLSLATQRLFPHAWLLKQSKWVSNSQPRVENLSRSKGSAGPAPVDLLSEYKRLSNIQRNKARWFPRSYGEHF